MPSLICEHERAPAVKRTEEIILRDVELSWVTSYELLKFYKIMSGTEEARILRILKRGTT